MSEQTDVILSLTLREYQQVADALARKPWIEVNALIGKVVGQYEAQQALSQVPPAYRNEDDARKQAALERNGDASRQPATENTTKRDT